MAGRDRPDLELRPLQVDDQARASAIHRAVAAEGDDFLVNRAALGSFGDYVAWLSAVEQGARLPTHWVPCMFRVGVVGDDLVGRATIRHRLNDRLEVDGGHVGYVVAPDRRRRGYGTAILSQAVGLAAGLGIARVLLTIAHDNVASIAVAERCGGRFDRTVEGPRGTMRRYWVPTECGTIGTP